MPRVSSADIDRPDRGSPGDPHGSGAGAGAVRRRRAGGGVHRRCRDADHPFPVTSRHDRSCRARLRRVRFPPNDPVPTISAASAAISPPRTSRHRPRSEISRSIRSIPISPGCSPAWPSRPRSRRLAQPIDRTWSCFDRKGRTTVFTRSGVAAGQGPYGFGTGMTGVGFAGMGFMGLLILVLVVLSIAAPIKYLRS